MKIKMATRKIVQYRYKRIYKNAHNLYKHIYKNESLFCWFQIAILSDLT